MSFVISNPNDLGFTQYPSFRQYQLQTILKIRDSDKKLIVISAPTGSGKTLLALGAGRALDRKTTILVPDRFLQQQYAEEEVAHTPHKVAWGRRNFPCILPNQNCSAAEAPCVSGESCDLMHPEDGGGADTIPCPYYRQRAEGDEASVRVLNYPFFFYETKFTELYRGHMVICDEGHRVDREILNVVSVTLNSGHIRTLRGLGFKMPPPVHEMLAFNPKIIGVAKDALTVVTVANDRTHNPPKAMVELERQLASLVRLEGKTVVVQVMDGIYKFTPVLVQEFRNLLWDYCSRVVLMSATIFGADIWAKRLGVAREDVEYIELPSSFPVENRPIYVKPVAKMSYTDFTTEKGRDRLTKMTTAIDRIVSKHMPQKGIIHSTSYDRANHYLNNSMFKDTGILMLGRTNEDIQEFIDCDGPRVLVSPRVTEGLDLPDDLCNFIIWPKVPWASTMDPVVAKKKEFDEMEWHFDAASQIVQGSGRGMRHDEDKCDTYILDAAFAYLYHQVTFPTWWKSAIQWER